MIYLVEFVLPEFSFKSKMNPLIVTICGNSSRMNGNLLPLSDGNVFRTVLKSSSLKAFLSNDIWPEKILVVFISKNVKPSVYWQVPSTFISPIPKDSWFTFVTICKKEP